ncbi:MAG: YdcF family protein [Hyphomonadaceae bacterium]|nr:YdcF family protein [Hyphomonadaceae bacterium]
MLYIVILGSGLVIAGFPVFVRHVTALTPGANIAGADGIVVWTGKGGGRLETGGRLLREGLGERILISGVNENTGRSSIVDLMGVEASLGECCVDLDYAAVNTLGNATETAIWADALAYEHIILVTSDYHMPRAMIELSAAAEHLRITPYPVAAQGDGKWWSDPALFRRLVTEYGKLLLTYARRPRGR